MLDVRLINLGGGVFMPALGAEFLILSANAGAPVGTFDNQPVSFAPGKVYLWTVLYSAAGVKLKVAGIVPCAADLNGDGVVSGADLAIVLGSWGPCRGCIADINQDGKVDGADLAIVLGAWGPCVY